MTFLASNRISRRYPSALLTGALFLSMASPASATSFVCDTDDAFVFPNETTVGPRPRLVFNAAFSKKLDSLRLVAEDESIEDVPVTIRPLGHSMFSATPARDLEPGLWRFSASGSRPQAWGGAGNTWDEVFTGIFRVDTTLKPLTTGTPRLELRPIHLGTRLSLHALTPFVVTTQKNPDPFVLGESDVEYAFRREANFAKVYSHCDSDVEIDSDEPLDVRVALLAADGTASAWSEPQRLEFTYVRPEGGCAWSDAPTSSSWSWTAAALVLSLCVRRGSGSRLSTTD